MMFLRSVLRPVVNSKHRFVINYSTENFIPFFFCRSEQNQHFKILINRAG